MGLRRSPLFSALGASGAVFVEKNGFLRADSFSGTQKECAAVRSGVGIYDRSHCPLVALSGRDTRRFCNGMFSNNVRDMVAGRSNQNAMLDDKGRIIGQLELWCVDADHLLATLEGVSAESFMERYDRYIIADDVEMEDQSEQYFQLSLQGPDARSLLSLAGIPVPEIGGITSVESLRVARRNRSLSGGFDLLVPADQLTTLWNGFVSGGAVPIGDEAQEVLRIEAGLPRWPVDMGEKALLHELRMVEEYCNFNKGCYIGQEVINRIDVMGQVTKKLFGLTMGVDAVPPVGAEVWLEGQLVGVVGSGAREGTRVRTLSVLRKSAWKPGAEVEVRAGEGKANALISDLPF